MAQVGVSVALRRVPRRSNVTVPPLRRLAIVGLLFALVLAALAAEPASRTAPAVGASAAERSAGDAYANLPLAFVPNAGQTDDSVRYQAQGAGFSFFFTERKAALVFQKGKRGQALDLNFVGANPHPELVGAERDSGTVNYLTGSEQHAGLPTYQSLVYRELWPGIDMVFRGQGGQLKYEFHVSPGANPADIRLAYEGARGVALGAGGALLIDTPLGTLRDARPQSFQRVDGRRVPVESSYALAGGSYGFALGRHDRGRPLVIDPGLAYSTYLGGSGNDDGLGIAVDSQGAAYVTGRTTSTNFPTTPGAFDASYNLGLDDAFVTKLDPTGSSLVYSTYLGGSSDFDHGVGIAVDSQGAAYVTGSTGSPDFPATPGAFDTSFNGVAGDDAFVTKLAPSGSSLVYSTYLGGSGDDRGTGIAVDPQGAAYVTGSAGSANFPTTPGAFDTTSGGADGDGFVTKLAPAGTSLVYSSYLGGSAPSSSGDGSSSGDVGAGIAVDSLGAAYVTGATFSTNFPTTPGAFDTSHNGFSDVFVTKVNPAGSSLAYSTYLGGSAEDGSNGIAIDSQGAAYVTGATFSPGFPTTPGAFDTSHNGFADAFVTKVNTSGSSLAYSTYLGGSGMDSGFGPAVDSQGAAHVTGLTHSPEFPITPGAFDTTGGPFGADPDGQDAFVTRLGSTGSSLAYSTYLGGSGLDLGADIALDSQGAAYIAGSTDSTDFPTTPGAFDRSLNNPRGDFVRDAFVTKLTFAAGAPASLTLAPKTATNAVGQQHCVTATVRDTSGSPVPGQTVFFSVSGANSASGFQSTDASGQARFCYTGTMTGNDAIKAFVDKNTDRVQQSGEPGDTAAKTWVAPASTAGCKVTGGGRITAKNGDKATFGGEARATSSSSASGNPEYTDHGPATPFKLKSTQVQAVVCSQDRKRATVFGRGTIDGSTQVSYRIDVTDNGEPGKNDTYRIRLSNGYDSGEQRLEGGNVQVR